MSGEVSKATELIERALQWARENRMNEASMYNQELDEKHRYTVRLTPWKQEERNKYMYLGCGASLVDAWRQAMGDAINGDDVTLDFSIRYTGQEKTNGPAGRPSKAAF